MSKNAEFDKGCDMLTLFAARSIPGCRKMPNSTKVATKV
jgi:hypothetical protein